MSSALHSVIFEKKYWTTSEARRELKKMHKTPIKRVDETQNYYRYRIIDPKEFRYFRIKNTGKGMKLVIGFY